VGKGEHDVQSIEPEVIPMRLSRRRTRPTVADLARVVSALTGAGGKLRKDGDSARQLHRLPRQIIQNPMDPGPPGCVRIVTDHRQASAFDRNPLLRQGGGEILALTAVDSGDAAAMAEVGRGELDRCGCLGHGLAPPRFEPEPNSHQHDEHRKHPLQGGAGDGLGQPGAQVGAEEEAQADQQ